MNPSPHSPDAVILDDGTLPEEYAVYERAMAKMFTMQDFWQAFRRNPLLVPELPHTAAEAAAIGREAQEFAQNTAALGVSVSYHDGMGEDAFAGTEPPTEQMRQWARDRLEHHYRCLMERKTRNLTPSETASLRQEMAEAPRQMLKDCINNPAPAARGGFS